MKKFAVFLALMPLAWGGMRQAWELQFGVRIKEPASWAIVKAHPILAAAFSPDGKQLAVAVDDHRTLTSNGTHVLLMDVAAPDRTLRQYDVETCGAPLGWSPEGEAILVCGYVLKLPGGKSCRAVSARASSVTPPFAFGALAGQIYWLSSKRILRSNPNGQLLDEDCREIDRWEAEHDWRVIGVAPARKWVLQLRNHPPRTPKEVAIARDEVSVVDAESHRTLAGWPQTIPAFSPLAGPPRFVVGAAALCLLWGDPHPPPGCWNVDGGQEIPLPKALRPYRLVGDSVSSSRILVERWGIDLIQHLDILPSPKAVQRRAVRDLRTGREIASWRPGEPDRVWPYGTWLSPDGHLVAQGGEGNLRLYRLE